MAATKPKVAKSDSKPDLPWVAITQTAIKAQTLAADNQTALGTRITTAFITAFTADITALTIAVGTTITVHQGAIQLTAAQDAALTSGYNLIKGVRTAVKSGSPDKAVLVAWGVGKRVQKTLVKDVRAGLVTISDRISGAAAEAAGFGITTDDLTDVTAAIAAIDAADAAQETGRATAPTTTRARNATARRLLAGIKLIAGAGMRVFKDDATTFANFEALVSRKAA